MENFTPISALIGGGLIGLSAVLLMWFNGRIAGISGILGAGLTTKPNASLWRWAFLLGIVMGPVVYVLVRGTAVLDIQFPTSGWWLAVGGFLVGIGTQFGSGCTSGHGVCGNARFSMRSLVATLTFMATGFATVYVMRVTGVWGGVL